jgi:hypothetical protein
MMDMEGARAVVRSLEQRIARMRAAADGAARTRELRTSLVRLIGHRRLAPARAAGGAP